MTDDKPALAQAARAELRSADLLARCGVYWGEDPMAEPEDERRFWWMGTDGAGNAWAIEDEITIALIQQFTRVLANVAARAGGDDGITQRAHVPCCWCGEHHEEGR